MKTLSIFNNPSWEGSRALVSDSAKKLVESVVTSTELGYLDGVTSAIQTQLNGKASSGSAVTFDKVVTTSNNLGDNIKLGDDCWIGDCWVSNGLQLKGNNDSAKAYIKFGTSGPVVGYDGSIFAIPSTLKTRSILPEANMAYGLGASDNKYTQIWGYAGYFDSIFATGIQTTGAFSPAAVVYPWDNVTASCTLNQSSLSIVNSANDLVLTLPSPSVGLSIKILVRTCGSVGHRIYPSTGNTIEFSGMYGTTYNNYVSNASGVPSGVACILRSGVYEFIGVSSSEWFLSSGPKTYA